MSNNKDNETCKIYLLTNNINKKIYVGQTWSENVEDRMGREGRGYSNSPYIFNAINKYGAENFTYQILTTCEDQETADILEDEYINLYDSRNHDIGYNIKQGGSAGKHSEETKRKISENVPRYWLGKHLSEESKKKISEKNTGRKHTEEWKKQTSEFIKNRHKENGHPMEGKHHTEEAKKKISQSSTGRKHDPEMVKRRAEKLKMDPIREAGIAEAYKNGCTVSEIQEMFEARTSAIYRVLYRNDIPLRQKTSKVKVSLELNDDNKKCTKCEIIQNKEDNFFKRVDGGVFSWCKDCINEYRRDKRKDII